MGPFDTADLAIAVSNAGALGVVSRTLVPIGISPPDRLRENIRKVAARAPLFGVNIPVSAEYVRQIKDSGALHFHVVSSVEHALKAERAGVDLLIASGYEAGGHLPHDPVTTSVLLPAVVRAVKIPVVAAGGFADGAGLVAALAGVQVRLAPSATTATKPR